MKARSSGDSCASSAVLQLVKHVRVGRLEEGHVVLHAARGAVSLVQAVPHVEYFRVVSSFSL